MKLTRNLLAGVAATAALTAGTAHSATLLHNWTFDGNANDSVGSANGTVNGGTATYVAGQVGQAISLDGIDDYVSTTAGTIVPATDYTLTAWVFWEAGNGSRGYIAGGQTGGAAGEVFTMSKANDGTDRILFLNLLINGGQGNSITESADNTISENAWQHVAYSVSSTSGTTIYLNGVAVGTNPTRTEHDPTANFNIGASLPTGTPANLFDGLIDDVALFDGVLSTSELATVRDQGAAAIPEPGSLALLGLGGLLVASRRRR
jgi:hypothetical protein